MRSKWDWVGAATGIASVALAVVSIAISGEPADAKDGSAEIIQWYTDKQDEVQISAALGTLSMLLLIFFFGYVRRVLRQAEGEGGTLSVIALVGAGIMGVGIAIDSTLSFAIAEAVDDKVDPTAIVAMQAIWDNDFFPIALGTSVILWAVGLSIVRHRGLPLWLGIIAIVLAVVSITPIGFFAVLGLAVWMIIASILLIIRATKAPETVHTTTVA